MRKHSTPGDWMALLLAAMVALLLALSLGATSAAASNGHGHKPSKKNKRAKGKAGKAAAPVSGIYDACAYSDPKNTPLPNCDDRLLALRQGGFRVVLNYWSSAMTVDENLHYLDTARSLRMQVILNLSNYRSYSLDQKL
jgi:hypothetical protein